MESIAAEYRTPRSDLLNMSLDEMRFWHGGAEARREARRPKKR